MYTQCQKSFVTAFFSCLLLMGHPCQSANGQELVTKRQSITYHVTTTVLWGAGATLLIPSPLAYCFFPLTYTYKINKQLTYSQFVMYRYENYRERPQSIWHNFHEIYVLPGVRFQPDPATTYGSYYALHAGLGGGVSDNFSLLTMNFMPEVGYACEPFCKGLFMTWNFSLLCCIPLYQNPVRYSWEKANFLFILSHMITPIAGLNIGWEF